MRSSVRLRITLLAAVALTLALGAGALGFAWVVRTELLERVETTAADRAAAVGQEIADGVPIADLTLPRGDDELVQVVGRGGAVEAASPLLEGRPPMAALEHGQTRTLDLPVDDDPFAVAARQAGEYLVLAAVTTDAAAEAGAVVVRTVAVAAPLLVLALAATTWLVVGRALAAVEAIRREAEEVSSTAPERRVPVTGDDEIGRLATTLNRMLDRLESGADRQRRFVADAAHELRTPLASLRHDVEVAAAHPDLCSVEELTAGVLGDVARMQDVVEALLLLARVDEGVLGRQRRPVDLDDLVLAEAERLRHEAPALTIDASGVQAARVDGDARSLAALLRNLGDNAARHARSRVVLAVGPDGAGVLLAVEDDGPGIPAADRERVLERFVRLDDARARDGGGSGLGLALVDAVARAHGGGTRVGEAGGLGGARVEVRLPGSADGQVAGRRMAP